MKQLNLDDQIKQAEIDAIRTQAILELWRALRDAGAVIQMPDNPQQEGSSDAIRND